MEHRGGIHTHARSHKHIAQLRTGRIGYHALDIGLDQTHRRGKQCRRRPDEGHKHHRLWGKFHQRRHADDKKYPGRHHCRGVDQGRNWCRAFHRVRQPCVQKQLRRFAHGTHEQQESDQVGRIPVGPQKPNSLFSQIRGGGENIIEFDAVGQVKQAKNTKRKAKIPHPVHNKRFDSRSISGRFFIIEPDQQIRRHANAFPTKEHLHKVVRRHQHQHRKGKKREVCKEPRAIAFVLVEIDVFGHVAKGIEMHEARNGRHHNQHDRGQTVHANGPIGGKRATFDKAQNLNMLGRPVKGQEHQPAEQCGQKQKPG